MTAPTLFDLADRHMADTSLDAFESIKADLHALEVDVLYDIYRYLRATGYEDVSGAELAAWTKRDKTSVRPRVTGLLKKGWCLKGPIRPSRAGEKNVHGVRPVLPWSAVERARDQIRQKKSGKAA